MSFAMGCGGATLRPGMVHTRRSTIASSAGAAWACSNASSPGLPGEGEPDRLMIDATHLKAHRTAASLLEEGIDIYADPRCIGRTKGGLNSKLHVVSNEKVDHRSCCCPEAR
jgi:hypothetical protein